MAATHVNQFFCDRIITKKLPRDVRVLCVSVCDETLVCFFPLGSASSYVPSSSVQPHALTEFFATR